MYYIVDSRIDSFYLWDSSSICRHSSSLSSSGSLDCSSTPCASLLCSLVDTTSDRILQMWPATLRPSPTCHPRGRSRKCSDHRCNSPWGTRRRPRRSTPPRSSFQDRRWRTLARCSHGNRSPYLSGSRRWTCCRRNLRKSPLCCCLELLLSKFGCLIMDFHWPRSDHSLLMSASH